MNLAWRRQVILKELYCAHGFPTFECAATACGLTMFNPFVPGATYSDVRRLIGNGMHVAQVGVLMGVVLSCIKLN
jgi:hypothetical protein